MCSSSARRVRRRLRCRHRRDSGRERGSGITRWSWSSGSPARSSRMSTPGTRCCCWCGRGSAASARKAAEGPPLVRAFIRRCRSSSRRGTKGGGCPPRIDNLLAARLPGRSRQIIVVSDGSTDDTLAAAGAIPHRRRSRRRPAGGKALALNAGVARARHEILVFADARQTFAADALRRTDAPVRRSAHRRGHRRTAARLRVGRRRAAGRSPHARELDAAPDPRRIGAPSADRRRHSSSRRSPTASACTGATRSSCGG